MNNQYTNPILAPYNTPYGAYPFDSISTEHYREAFALALEEKRREVDAIIYNTELPTFENTILALENCGEMMERVCGIFFNLLHSHADDELMAISEEVIPQLTELSTYIALSTELFERVKAVYDQRASLNLSPEELRLLENCYEGFAESGATLPQEQKDRLAALSQEMSMLTLSFGQNNLKDQARYRLHITDPESVKGMPESSLTMARELAEREGKGEGWLFDLTAPSYFPFMQHCPDSSLREQMYRAKMAVGAAGDEYDNQEIIRRLVNGRLEEAQLLGYNSFADYALHRRMAKTPQAVYELLDKLLVAYKPTAEQELREVETFARSEGFDGKINAWDWSYWAERYRQRYYELDDEMLRPYFELSRVIDAVFGLATTLYGIRFVENTQIPVYHPDVKAFEVLDQDGSYLGLLYTDFFPRKGKQSGAWMNNLQEQFHLPDSSDHRPHIVLVMNFTPPTADKPALLTAGEVGTFLHEFGHALHGLLSDCRFSSLSGTSVTRDFVELPSQLMENWLTERAWLDSFAVHYQTGETIPSELLDKLLKAKNFLAGYATCRQLSFGYLDMAWHTLSSPLEEGISIKQFEDTAWAKALVLPPSPEGTMMSTSFGHIFSGGYSAGYYGYKWAEVLDADAFSVFQKEGIFSREVAERFRREVLSQGDKRDAMELYRAFRGEEPSVEALLRRDGIAIE